MKTTNGINATLQNIWPVHEYSGRSDIKIQTYYCNLSSK